MHIANVLLMYALCLNLLELPTFYLAGSRERKVTAFFSTAIWAVFALHTETTGQTAWQSDMLATFFYLLTMQIFALEQRGKIKTRLFWALPMVIGCLCHRLIISLPLALFALAWSINSESKKRKPEQNTLSKSLEQTLPAFIIIAAYILLGLNGIGLNGISLNSAASETSLTKSQVINADNPLPLILRVIWGLCGVMTLVNARLGGAIATKYRLILFAFAWLAFTLLPDWQFYNQFYNLAAITTGGYHAYLQTLPISLLIVFSVYPIGVSALGNNQGGWAKFAAILTLSALIVTMSGITYAQTRAGSERKKCGALGTESSCLRSASKPSSALRANTSR